MMYPPASDAIKYPAATSVILNLSLKSTKTSTNPRANIASSSATAPKCRMWFDAEIIGASLWSESWEIPDMSRPTTK